MEPLVVLVTASPVPRRGPRLRAWAAWKTLVVVADPAHPGPTLAEVLTRAGFSVRPVQPDLDRAAPWPEADCVVIDARAVGGDLEEMVRTLAARDPAPRILVVTGAASARRTALLLSGADDVAPAPVCPQELVARVVGVVAPPVEAPEPIIEIGSLTIDRNRRSVHVAGEQVVMQPLQYDLLVVLAEAAGRPVDGRTLLERCWDLHQVVNGDHLRPQLARLRLALGGACSITCVRGQGYVLRCAP